MTRTRVGGWMAWLILAVWGGGVALRAWISGMKAAGSPPVLRVDVNGAAVEPLLALPGVGERRVGVLVRRRPYADLADLEARVPGLGSKRMAALAAYVRFGGPAGKAEGPR